MSVDCFAIIICAIVIIIIDVIIAKQIYKIGRITNRILLLISHTISAFFFYTISIRFITTLYSGDTIFLFKLLPQLKFGFGLLYLPKLIHFAFYLINKMIPSKMDTITPEDPPETAKIPRRVFINKVGIATAALTVGNTTYKAAIGGNDISIENTNLYLPELPNAFHNTRIIQISDLHLGNLNGRGYWIEQIINSINARNPDIIFFTGDIVNNFANEAEGWEKRFRSLQSKLGKWSVLGNHDYGIYHKWHSERSMKKNFNNICNIHERFEFNLLRNTSQIIEKNGEKLAIMGSENWGPAPNPQYGDIDKTTDGINDMAFKILLTHDPMHWEKKIVDQYNIPLTLSGHTHGQQTGHNFNVQLKGLNHQKWEYRFYDGLYKQNNQYLNVNRGIGISDYLPFSVSPEVSSITLKKG